MYMKYDVQIACCVTFLENSRDETSALHRQVFERSCGRKSPYTTHGNSYEREQQSQSGIREKRAGVPVCIGARNTSRYGHATDPRAHRQMYTKISQGDSERTEQRAYTKELAECVREACPNLQNSADEQVGGKRPLASVSVREDAEDDGADRAEEEREGNACRLWGPRSFRDEIHKKREIGKPIECSVGTALIWGTYNVRGSLVEYFFEGCDRERDGEEVNRIARPGQPTAEDLEPLDGGERGERREEGHAADGALPTRDEIGDEERDRHRVLDRVRRALLCCGTVSARLKQRQHELTVVKGGEERAFEGRWMVRAGLYRN